MCSETPHTCSQRAKAPHNQVYRGQIGLKWPGYWLRRVEVEEGSEWWCCAHGESLAPLAGAKTGGRLWKQRDCSLGSLIYAEVAVDVHDQGVLVDEHGVDFEVIECDGVAGALRGFG